MLFLPAAEADLEEVWQYVADAGGSAPRADAYVRRLYDTMVLLAEHPMMGRTRDELRPGLRSFPAERYVIYYEPLDDGEGVLIARVLRGERDVQPPLFQ
ncbi:MAG: type II toxin-antitoxin system RelE/ParE family toxin [Bacteroidota bacterium]